MSTVNKYEGHETTFYIPDKYKLIVFRKLAIKFLSALLKLDKQFLIKSFC